MKRKIVKQGGTALTITLPAVWCKKHHLKAGDELNLEEMQDDLIVEINKKKRKKQIDIKLTSGYPKYIRAILRNTYIHGYEVVCVKYHSKTDYVTISNYLDNFIGFEITKEESDGCVIESISDIKYDQYINFLNKQFQIIQTMQDLIADAMRRRTTKHSDLLMETLHNKADRYACLCRRALTRNNLMNNDDAIAIYFVISLIHMIARNCNNCYKYFVQNKINPSNFELSYLLKARSMFNDLYELFQNKNKKSTSITEKRHKLLCEILPKSSKSRNNQIIIYHLSEMIRLTGTCAPKIGLLRKFWVDSISKGF